MLTDGKVAVVVGAYVFVTSFVIQDVRAVDLDYQLGAATEYSDNIRRSVSGSEEPELILRYRAGLSLVVDNPGFISNTILGATYRDYVRDIFSDRTDYLVNSRTEWNILERRLILHVDDRFARIQTNPAEPDTPNNLQNTNVFSIGPEINVRMGSRDRMVFNARYTDTYYQATSTDNYSLGGSAVYLRQFTPISTLDVRYTAEGMKYDNPVYATVITQEATLGYSREPSTVTRIALRAGGTEVIYRGSSQQQPGWQGTGAFEMSRRVSRQSVLDLLIGREFTEAGRTFIRTPQDQFEQIEATLSGVLFLTSRARARYFRQTSYGSQLLAFRGRKIEYKNLPDITLSDVTSDRDLRGLDAQLVYNLSRARQVGVEGSYTRTDYLDTARIDRDTRGGIWLNHQIRSNLSARLIYSRRERKSSSIPEEYVESRGILALVYNTEVTAPGSVLRTR